MNRLLHTVGMLTVGLPVYLICGFAFGLVNYISDLTDGESRIGNW